MAPTLRRANSADVAMVTSLTREAYAPLIPLIGREPTPMTADYAHAIADHMIDIYEQGGQAVALIELIQKPDHLWIENIAVRPEHHGKGIGGKLLQHAEDVTRSLSLDEVRLFTNVKFVANISFYAKRGYEEFLRETHETLGEAVHMKKRVNSSLSK